MQTEMGATATTFLGKTEVKTRSAGIEKALMKTPKVTKDPNESGDPTTIGRGSEARLNASGTIEPQDKENIVDSEQSSKPQSTRAKVSTKSQAHNQNSQTNS